MTVSSSTPTVDDRLCSIGPSCVGRSRGGLSPQFLAILSERELADELPEAAALHPTFAVLPGNLKGL